MPDRVPGFAASFRNQAWLLGVSGRWLYVGLGLLALLVLLELSTLSPEVMRTMIAMILCLPAGAVWAVVVWHGEGPTRRSYHWSLPVTRPVHDLARVTVGAAYLLLLSAAWIGAGALADAMNGLSDAVAVIPTRAWLNALTAPLTTYLGVSAIVLWSEYPITRRLLGGWVALSVLAAVLSWQGVDALGEFLKRGIEGNLGFGTALLDGFLPDGPGAPWEAAAATWAAFGVGAVLFTATFRPDDLRRLVRSGVSD